MKLTQLSKNKKIIIAAIVSAITITAITLPLVLKTDKTHYSYARIYSSNTTTTHEKIEKTQCELNINKEFDDCEISELQIDPIAKQLSSSNAKKNVKKITNTEEFTKNKIFQIQLNEKHKKTSIEPFKIKINDQIHNMFELFYIHLGKIHGTARGFIVTSNQEETALRGNYFCTLFEKFDKNMCEIFDFSNEEHEASKISYKDLPFKKTKTKEIQIDKYYFIALIGLAGVGIEVEHDVTNSFLVFTKMSSGWTDCQSIYFTKIVPVFYHKNLENIVVL